jgi:hypothetical protein
MKALVASLELVWAIANFAVAVLLVTSAFAAKTAIKEGLLAQAVLLLGGVAMAVFAYLLARQCLDVLRVPEDTS